MINSILSAGGGAGGTTTGILLAEQIIRKGGKCLTVDARSIRKADICLSLENLILGVYEGRGEISGYIYGENDSLPHYLAVDGDVLNGDISSETAFRESLEELKNQYDEVILFADEDLILRSPEWADRIIVVLTQDQAVLRTADKIITDLKNAGADEEKIFIIINKWENTPEGSDTAFLSGEEDIYSLFEEEVLGRIPFNQSLRLFSDSGKREFIPPEVAGYIFRLSEKIRIMSDEIKLNEKLLVNSSEEDGISLNLPAISENSEAQSKEKEGISEEKGIFRKMMNLLKGGRE